MGIASFCRNVLGIVMCLFAASGTAWPESPKTVLVVSIDALHPKALNAGVSPMLDGLMDQGVSIRDGRSTDPPLTLIAHTAMVTGLEPEASGKTDNTWSPGHPTLERSTFFDTFSHAGFATGYFYSKIKLGFLVNGAVDSAAYSPDFSIDNAVDFIGKHSPSFVFLHVSGLDREGPENGWLSPEYLEELSYIDQSLAPLIADVQHRGKYLIVITGDHAGHGKLHGTGHPEDFRVPLILLSDTKAVPESALANYTVSDLKRLVEETALK